MRSETLLDLRQFDDVVPGVHLGLIVLDMDQVTEADFMRMKPPGVFFYTTRVPYADTNTMDNLRAIGDHLRDAAGIILPREVLGAVVYSCTSGTVALGHDQVVAEIQQAQPNVPVITPITSAFRAFGHLGLSRISFLNPYPEEIAHAMIADIQEAGYDVTNNASFAISRANDLQRLTPTAIVAGAKHSFDPTADALFIPGTGIRAVEVIAELEAALGKPVLTSNQCMFWDSLTQAGFTDPIDGFGILMREAR